MACGSDGWPECGEVSVVPAVHVAPVGTWEPNGTTPSVVERCVASWLSDVPMAEALAPVNASRRPGM